MSKSKIRIDLYLVEKSLVETREKAQRMILAGLVLVNDEPITKPGAQIAVDAVVRVKQSEHPYVSRGGVKLAGALDHFGIGVEGTIGLDVGASTGGFTHVLLLRGIQKVYALDVGQNQMDWKIRSDPKVVVFEKVNARYLEPGLLAEKVDFVCMDVSFISVTQVLPAIVPVTHSLTDWVILIKPQFEVGKGRVGRGGIVRSLEDQMECIEKVKACVEALGLTWKGYVSSMIQGSDGNQEYLAYLKSSKK